MILFVEDADLRHHQQTHVADEVGCKRVVLDVVAIDVETESLTLDATAVRA